MILWILGAMLLAAALALWPCIREPYTNASTGAMVIVEPRAHPKLRDVIHAFHVRVPRDWTLYVVHGTANRDAAATAVRDIRDRRVVLRQLSAANLTPDQYNRLLTSPQFWSTIDADHVLVFQTDSMPCSAPLDIGKFGSFGYIGCAYGDKVGRNTYWGPHNSFYGVGGLSLRRKEFMLRCLQHTPPGTPEDVAFSNCVDTVPGYPKPTAVDVGDFCAQNSWGPRASPQSWGVHQFQHQMPASQKSAFLQHCPRARDV